MPPSDDVKVRLVRCFQAVFPALSEEGAEKARPESVAGWDSIATVTLLNVVEEEFKVEFGPEDLERLTSFDALLDRLEQGAA